MKHIKLFENYDQPIDNFFGIDTSEIKSFAFIWSNAPHISDYTTVNGYGTSEKRMALANAISIKLKGISKKEFLDILKKNFSDIKISTSQGAARIVDYMVNIVDEDVPAFFELIRNIEEYK